MEGNHGAALPYLAIRSDHIIVLEVPPWICLVRVLKRYFQHDTQLKKAISEGWEEKLSWQFIWFILWLFPKNFGKQKQQIEQIAKGEIHLVKDTRRFNLNYLQ